MKQRAILFSCLLAVAAGQAARGADPAEDIETQYQAALAALKKPDVTGILITEVEAESAAGTAGMRAGDILTEYYGARITTLRGLREQVAEAVARHLEDPTAGKRVLARVRRGGNVVVVQMPREPLGVRAVEVEAGVPGPRNPPPNLRGTLALNWKQVAANLAEEKEAAPFRLLERVAAGDAVGGGAGALVEEWSGWELCKLTPEGEATLSGRIDLFRLDTTTTPKDEKDMPTEHSTFTFHLQLGDYKNGPAFVLDAFSARYTAAAGLEDAQVVATGKRVGEKLQTTVTLTKGEKEADSPLGAAEHHENTVPLNAVPQAAMPWVAAAMPHETGASLGVYLLSMRDFLARPGYVVVTRGRQAIPADPNVPLLPGAATETGRAAGGEGWRVDLMHVGVVIESYWFSDQCRLLYVETQGAQQVIARRVDSAKTASLPQDRRPARPATLPASTAPSGAL